MEEDEDEDEDLDVEEIIDEPEAPAESQLSSCDIKFMPIYTIGQWDNSEFNSRVSVAILVPSGIGRRTELQFVLMEDL